MAIHPLKVKVKTDGTLGVGRAWWRPDKIPSSSRKPKSDASPAFTTHIIHALSRQLVTVFYTLDKHAYQYRLRQSVVCSLHFLIHNCVPLFICFLLTSYTQFRKNSDNVHKDDWNKVLCTHFLCKNTSNVRRVGHNSFPLTSRDSLTHTHTHTHTQNAVV